MKSKKFINILIVLAACILVACNVLYYKHTLLHDDEYAPPIETNGITGETVMLQSGSDLEDDLSHTDMSLTDASETDISASDMSDSDTEEKPDLNQYALITQSASLREKATSDSKRLATIKKNTKVIVIGVNSKETWYNVKYDDKTGWVYKTCIELIRNRELDAVLYPAVPEAVSGQVQDINGTAVDKYMGEIAEDYHATSVQIAIIENGSVAYTMEYGYADLEDKTEATSDTKYRIASLTKVFTSMNIMKATEDGKLSLDEDVGEVSGHKTRNPRFKSTEITMKMLITHTSSFVDSEETYELYPWTQLSKKESYLNVKPGTRFNYSNYGMGYAAACLEKRTDMQISQFAEENFLNAMNIDASYDGTRLDDKSLVSALYSGSVVTRSVENICKAPRFSTPGETYNIGAGGLIISAKDYAALITILMNEGKYNGTQYLSKETVELMLTPQINASGFQQCIGIRLKEDMIDGRTMYYHPGSMYGLYSLMAFDPSDGSGVVVITNGASGVVNDKNLYSVCADIAQFCYDEVINV